MRTKKVLLSLLFLLTLVTLIPDAIFSKTTVKAIDPSAFTPPDGKKLVWSDEFDGPGINLSNWMYETKATGWSQSWNNEYQNYTDNGTNGPNAFISNGNLVIKATRVNVLNDYNAYKSARLSTYKLKSWKYGVIAARIRMPYGNGIWPAFWMLGANIRSDVWPKCGEIDIVEMIGGVNGEQNGGGDDMASGALHGPGYSGDSCKHEWIRSEKGKLSDDYHIYWVNWTPTEIVWYFDSTQYLKVTSADVDHWVFDHEFYILLNLAVGGSWPKYPDQTTVFPQTMTVDWVRVYQ